MKVLLISNMWPSKEKPYSGIFVVNQFNGLVKDSRISQIDVFAMERTFTGMIGSLLKYIRSFLRFVPILFRKYDIIHVHFFFPFILLAVAYKAFHSQTRLVTTIHGSDVSRHIRSSFNKFIFRKAASFVDYLIAVGREMAMETEQKLHRKVDLILSAGVDESVFFQVPGTEKKYDFVFAGSFIERKGIDLIIEAIKKVSDLKIRFCFIGSGKFRDAIRELTLNGNAALMENLTQEQIRLVFNQSRFIILPSRQEPFGLVITEAMYCGVPAIVSGAGGLPEQVRHGYNGFILPENTPAAIEQAIRQAMGMTSSDYSAMSDHALQSNKQHALSRICDTHIKIYRQLLNKADA